jgi:putative transposase
MTSGLAWRIGFIRVSSLTPGTLQERLDAGVAQREVLSLASQAEFAFCDQSIDITYVHTQEGFLYLAFILDVYSRRVVGWSMASHLRTELVVDALEMALWRRNPKAGLIHHTDRGAQYTALSFGKKLEEARIVPSMGRVGSALDNAILESFVASLKTELIHRSSFPTREAAKVSIFEFVEGFYYRVRRHSSLVT